MALALSAPVFAITSQLIEEATGLHYDVKDADLLGARLSRRAGELGFDSLLDYYYFLRYDAGGANELDALVDLLVVNETYLFREADQLRVLVEQLLPARLETQPRARIWCAACSTGEEAFTLACLLDEHALLDRVDIEASDISARVLATAEKGVYSGRSLRALSLAERRHFIDAGDGSVQVPERIKARIRWRRVNLLKPPPRDEGREFDVILCRNALIYFADETVVQIVGSLTERLPAGGYLLVGASESLLRYGTALGCEEHGGAFFYPETGAVNDGPVRILVVDDSAFARKVVREVLEGEASFDVVDIARDGLDALEKIAQLTPDVVTLDLVMPGLDGVGVLKALSSLRMSKPPRVVIVSMAEDDSDLVVQALQSGAVDFVHKPTALATDRLFELRDELRSKVLLAAHAGGVRAKAPVEPVPWASSPAPLKRAILVVGASTGGPQAITAMLGALPSTFPIPIAIALHMPIGYTEALARRLDEICAIEVVEAHDGVELRAGRAVVARAGMHLRVQGGTPPLGRLEMRPLEKPHRPSVDVLLSSAAAVFGDRCIGVVLTGMGDDGLEGARALKRAGSVVLTQSEASCVVYGMPRCVEAAGLSDRVLPLDAMAQAIREQLV